MSDKWYIAGPLGIGEPEPHSPLTVSGEISLKSPDNNIYSLQFVRKDEENRQHKWALWHMNKANRKNALEIWEYKTDSTGKDCGGNTNDGAMCNPRLTISEGGNIGIGTTVPTAKLEVDGDIRANRYCGLNTKVINDYQTPNPSSNVYLYSPGNDRDSWLFLDSADTSSNWGIYHRQIDVGVKSLPANSIGFIGGGKSDLKAYISLSDGSAYFKGNVGIGTAEPVRTLDITGSLRASSEIQTTSANAFRLVQGNYGSFLRNDGIDTYLLLTNAGDQYGSWNNLRPLHVNNVSGDIWLGDGHFYVRGSDGRVGIGTNDPKATLDVNGIITAAGGRFDGVAIGAIPDIPTYKYGYETIGTPSPDHNLRIFSRNWIIFHTDGSLSENGTAGIDQSGLWHGSSRKLKYDICDLTREQAMSALETLRPVTFLFHHDKGHTRRSGFIAEEVPAMVANKDHTMINQMDIIAILTRAVKEQQGMIRGILQDLSSRH